MTISYNPDDLKIGDIVRSTDIDGFIILGQVINIINNDAFVLVSKIEKIGMTSEPRYYREILDGDDMLGNCIDLLGGKKSDYIGKGMILPDVVRHGSTWIIEIISVQAQAQMLSAGVVKNNCLIFAERRRAAAQYSGPNGETPASQGREGGLRYL